MRTCSSCGYSENRDEARFCIKCAAPLAPPTNIACLRCGTLNPPEARYCLNCASPLVRVPAIGMTGLLTPNTLLQARYMIADKIGEGGMGAVYLAHDTRLQGKQWALKEMSDAQLTDPAERQNAVVAFRREAQLLATLDHANLPKVVDFFQEGGKHYLVMDFIQGQSLERAVLSAPGFLPEATVLGWIEQVCDVLEYLHSRQPPIIFRDLKPSNIMLTSEGKIKLIDFGIARFFQAGKAKDTAAYGTMGYAAPEQFGTGQTDARSDIYALGVTLHFLLTKYDPSLTPFNLPPARNINPQVSAQAEAVIACATRPIVGERFQSATAMKQAIGGSANLTAATPPVSTLGPARAPITPYVFAPGKTASTVVELVQLCKQDWDRAVAQFYDGNFELWLKCVGEFGLASEAKRLTAGHPKDVIDKELGLQAWIQQTGVGRRPPSLAISPARVELEWSSLNIEDQQPCLVATIVVGNKGGGVLAINLAPSHPWISTHEAQFVCTAGQKVSVGVFVDMWMLVGSRSTAAELRVLSNAETCSIPLVMVGARPVLRVSPLVLDFGFFGYPKKLAVENAGPGTLKGRIVSDCQWLTFHPERFESNQVTVQVMSAARDLGLGSHSGTLEIRSNGGTQVVKVKARI